MFEIPPDIELQLSQRFPQVDVRKIVSNLFQLILDKTLEDSSCSVRGLGKFLAYSVYSGKSKTNLIRFKFKPAECLRKRIRTDKYLLKTVKAKNQTAFIESTINETHREIRDENLKTMSLAEKYGLKSTKDKILDNFITEMIKEV